MRGLCSLLELQIRIIRTFLDSSNELVQTYSHNNERGVSKNLLPCDKLAVHNFVDRSGIFNWETKVKYPWKSLLEFDFFYRTIISKLIIERWYILRATLMKVQLVIGKIRQGRVLEPRRNTY